jgi:membrane fusion protein, multidrug efflux system
MRKRSVGVALAIGMAGLAAMIDRHAGQIALAQQGGGPAPVPVTAELARLQDMPIYQLGLGAVQAYNTVSIKVRVDGSLDKVAFTEGQEVKAGDLLAQIDPRPYQAQLAQAQANKARDEAQLANARLDLVRFSDLVKKEFATRQSVDTQEALVAQSLAAVQGDDAAIDIAKVQLGYTTIVAPITGRTGIRLVDQGNIVHASDPGGLVVITQLQPISVIFTLPEASLPAVNKALAAGTLPVEAWSQDDSEKLDEGAVALVDNQIDAATGTMKLKATFPNSSAALWPGQFVNAHLRIETRHDAVTVPVQAVQRGPKGTFAWVIKPDDKSVEMRPITVGYSTSDFALIQSGLSAGDLVVIDGQYKLVIGAKVDIRMSQPKQTAEVPEQNR